MSGLKPAAPSFPSSGTPCVTVCEFVQPRKSPGSADLFRLCKALPPGMPDKLEVSVIRSQEGIERSTAAYYGGRAYLIHIAMTTTAR